MVHTDLGRYIAILLQYIVTNILYWGRLTIQYIVLVGLKMQYIVLAGLAIQYIVLAGLAIQYIVLLATDIAIYCIGGKKYCNTFTILLCASLVLTCVCSAILVAISWQDGHVLTFKPNCPRRNLDFFSVQEPIADHFL